MKLGISGVITKAFIQSPLTPLLLLISLVVGMVALSMLPREEEPQISVPMVDILISANGLKAQDAVELVTEPLEDIVKSIDAVEHVYSQTQDDMVVVTARFLVGTSEDDAILRIHENIRANLTKLPHGIEEPLIVGRGINDVAIVTLTLSATTEAMERWDDNALYAVADELQHELVKVDNVGQSYIVGGRENQIRVEPDPEKLALHGVALNQLIDKIEHANRSFMIGRLREANRSVPVVAGQTLQGVPDVGLLLLTTYDGRPVYVKDVAQVIVGAKPEEKRVWALEKSPEGVLVQKPAVTLAFAKRQGANAVFVSEDLLDRLELVKGRLLPDSVRIDITRNYGETATEKADELLFHLGLATVSIVILIYFSVGWRESIVVAVVIPTTILLTLFASYLMGYTINRVSLFALIFSIGILVDDAIVVVENIVRHWNMKDDRSVLQKAIEGVAEVGNPTIIATLTIVAALLPMMFVSGLMGPYMSPIPANASAAMLFSFFVAVIITPWLLMLLRGRMLEEGGHHDESDGGRMGRFYARFARPVIRDRRMAKRFLTIVGVATIVSCGLFYTKHVTVKLLPFDNKSEIQVVVDLAEGSSLEETERTTLLLSKALMDVPEVMNMQAYIGTSMPFNFNGLVRHYYLREKPEYADLQINLLPKHERDRESHEIALEVRERLNTVALPDGASVKVVEVPPGPPVMATLLTEVYGPDAESRRAAATKLRTIFEEIDFIVDVDDSFGQPSDRLRLQIDQERLEFHGVEEEAVYDTMAALIGGMRVGYSHRGEGADPVEIAVRLPKSDLHMTERLLATPVPGAKGNVELGEVITLVKEVASYPIYRRDGYAAEMVSAELAGAYEAPIYGMFAVEEAIENVDWGTLGMPALKYHGQPMDETHITFLWDGEWEVTYVTFRDMGAAFGVAILAIYLLVVGQFSSFKLPLVILVPVPLTLIGIVIGHWLFSAPFTATSMIGFIALAGIIVRNSILLVDFIRHRQGEGRAIRDVVLEAGMIRFKPIFLTAAAAIIGAAFILADPIFQGLAISLVFGLFSSTALTLLVIPAIYVVLRDDGKDMSL